MMRSGRLRGMLLPAARVGVIAACVDTSARMGPVPTVVALAVAPNPYSTLSFVVTFKGDAVDSARVQYQEPDGSLAREHRVTQRKELGFLYGLGLAGGHPRLA